MPRYYKDKIFSKTDKDENNIKTISERDKKINEKIYEDMKNNVNTFENELLVKNDQKRKLDNIIKMGKL